MKKVRAIPSLLRSFIPARAVRMGVLAVLGAAIGFAAPAGARPGGMDGRPFGRAGLMERPALRDDLRAGQRPVDAPAAETEGRRCEGPCRMSPEERRQLRRDIHDVGVDLYRRGPRRERD